MTANYAVVKGYSEELVRVASYPPLLALTVESRLGIYPDRHERAMPKSKAALVNIIVSCCRRKLPGQLTEVRLSFPMKPTPNRPVILGVLSPLISF